MKSKCKGQTGLSMPELMVAMTVLFIVSTFIMSMFVTGMRQTAQATQNQQLESLTRQKVSEAREIPYDQLDVIELTGSFPAPENEYSYLIEFLPLPSESAADARVVQVTVSTPSTEAAPAERYARTLPPSIQGPKHGRNSTVTAATHWPPLVLPLTMFCCPSAPYRGTTTRSPDRSEPTAGKAT